MTVNKNSFKEDIYSVSDTGNLYDDFVRLVVRERDRQNTEARNEGKRQEEERK